MIPTRPTLYSVKGVNLRVKFCASPSQAYNVVKFYYKKYCLGKVTILIALTMKGYVYKEYNVLI